MSVRTWRIVNRKSDFLDKKIGLNTTEAAELNFEIENSRPGVDLHDEEWHELLYTPFRYPLPVDAAFSARFRPPYSTKNVLYASETIEAAAAEAGYHFLKERAHLHKKTNEEVTKVRFNLLVKSDANLIDVRKHHQINLIMSDDYSESHIIAKSNLDKDGFIYPSARISSGTNYAITELRALEKDVLNQEECYFLYSAKEHKVLIKDSKNNLILEFMSINIFKK